MKTCHIDADRIWKVWEWCSDSYLRSGIRLSFPKNTKPERTYQWRYCKAIAEKFTQWDFDDSDCQHFIDIAVKYAKKAGSLRKGLAVLHQGNMLDAVYDILQGEKSSTNDSIDVLEHTKRWLKSQIGNRPPLEVLLERQDADSLTNIAIWYQASKLPGLYIALSKMCCQALARLKKQGSIDNDLLPTVVDLYRLRSDFIDNDDNLREARVVLGKDWRELCH
jgi:hypothetical protein